MTPITCRWYRRNLARIGEAAPGGGDTRTHRHVRSCERCRRALADQELVARELANLQLRAPSQARVWRRIEQQLDGAEPLAPLHRLFARRLGRTVRWVLNDSPIWAVAIVALLAVLGLWQARERAVSEHPRTQSEAPNVASSTAQEAEPSAPRGRHLEMVPLNLDVGTYVQEVSSSAEPDEFWNAYRAREPETDSPYRSLAFQPVVPDRLPHGFRRVDSKLLRDACCETLQVRYESADRWLDIFQCHNDHPIEFGWALVDRRDVDGIICTAFDWEGGRVRGRSFSLGELSVVAVGNVSDEVLDDVVADLGRR